MKAKKLPQKRNNHSYKCYDKAYSKAMKRAKKEKVPFATMLEEIVEAYGDGASSVSFIKDNQTITTDTVGKQVVVNN